MREQGQSILMLVAEGSRCPIELRDIDGERLGVTVGTIVQRADCQLLAQQDRVVAGAAEVDTSVDAVPSGDVPRKLRQLAIDSEAVAVGAGVGHERKTILARNHDIGAGGQQ